MENDTETRVEIGRLLVCRCTNCYHKLPGYDVHGPGWNWVTRNCGPFCDTCFEEAKLTSKPTTTRNWSFRDDGSFGEELRGIPNGFREFIVALAEFLLQPHGRYRNLGLSEAALLPNEDWLNTKVSKETLAKWPGLVVKESR